MSELKTKRNRKSVKKFLNSVENERRRSDAFQVLSLMEDVTGAKPEMWGDSIIGFGTYTYRYKDGREMDWFLAGFSPRKASLTLYIMCDSDRFQKLLGKLGKHKTSRACLYINRLEDVDMKVLRRLTEESISYLQNEENAPPC